MNDGTLIMIDWPTAGEARSCIDRELRALGARWLSEDVCLIRDAADDGEALARLRTKITRSGGTLRVGCIRDLGAW